MIKFNKHHDDWWFEEKYKDIGISGRDEYFKVYLPFKEKGEPYTFSQNVKKGKGRGSTGGPQKDNPTPRKNKKFIPPRFDFEELFDFKYDEMFNSPPNKKFKKLNHIIFNHEYYNESDQKIYERYIKLYNEWKVNGNLEKMNDLVQRLSSYIWKNKLNTEKKVGGGVICAVAVMISNYITTGELNTNIDDINKLNVDELNTEINKFCLFLLCQIITTKHHWVDLYINDNHIKNWYIISYMRHRETMRDYKSKNIIPSFYKDEYGNLSFYLY